MVTSTYHLKMVTSTYHLKMKFTTEEGVRVILDKQVVVRECYVQELKGKNRSRHVTE